MTTPSLSRRRFLQSTAATLLSAPFVTTGMRAASPNGKLRHLAFGAAGMSMADMSSLSNHPNWELAAVCDVDKRNFDSKKFGELKARFPEVRLYRDWREALEKEAGKVD